MKTKQKVGLMMIDEAQDLPSIRMEIIKNISKSNIDLNIYIAGDYLQTVFYKETAEFDTHAMNIFKEIRPRIYDLNKCMRCPNAHVAFNNMIMCDIQRKYSIPMMESNNKNTIDKPLLFTHRNMSNTTDSRVNAEQVTEMIQILMKNDPEIKPDDIAIIMGKTTDNTIYYQLLDTLNKLYVKMGHNECVCHMATKGVDGNKPLDWINAAGKTKMLSIQGDKGRGHKVVFFLGLTENSIPRDIHIHKPSEIIPESLLNVGTTRSLKYLFIGFTYAYPSRYLAYKKDNLSDYAYCSWNNDTATIPEPYKSIIIVNQKYNNLPVWDIQYNNKPNLAGINVRLRIKDDISKDFENTKYLYNYQWKKTGKFVLFGELQEIKTPLQEDHYALLGVMAELLLQRLSNNKMLFSILLRGMDKTKIIYTDDERLLSCMHDVKNLTNDMNEFEQYLKKYKKFFDNNIELKNNIVNAYQNNKIVLHSIFGSSLFRKDIVEFTSPKKNDEIDSACLWNITLFYNQITQRIYRPAVNAFFGYFNEDISVLHNNIKIYTEQYLNTSSNIEYEGSVSISGALTNDEMERLNVQNKYVSINGRYDIYDSSNSHLYEIKTSMTKEYSQEWLTQTLSYALLLDVYKKPVKTMSIVNVLSGKLWEWSDIEFPKIEDIVKKKIRKKYRWHKCVVAALINGIKHKRETLE